MWTDCKKAGGLSIFCAIWNLVMGFMLFVTFVFSSFDMGEAGYARVGSLYKEIAHNISWIGLGLGMLGLVSGILLLVGGIRLLLNRQNTQVSTFGLRGIYYYFLVISVMAFLLGLSGGNQLMAFFWIGGCLLLLIPSFFLQQMLRCL